MGVSKVLASPLWVWMWFGGHLARAETRHLPVIMQQNTTRALRGSGVQLEKPRLGPRQKVVQL